MSGTMPDKELARQLAEVHGYGPVSEIRRMTTGLCHYVYEAHRTNAPNVVVRIASDENRHMIESAVYWSDMLRPKGVPLPEILYADYQGEHPFMILERLPGTDLGDVYPQLSSGERKGVALRLQDIQARVCALQKGNGYGYTASYDGPFDHPDMMSLCRASLNRAREWISTADIFSPAIVDDVESAFKKHEDYLAAIQPIPHLHDITTKNVLIHEGALSGIVDVDDLCFGDPIRTIALTQTALLSRGQKTDYIDYWCEAARMTAEQKIALAIYTAENAVCFLGEMGQAFNKEKAEPPDMGYAQVLLDVINGQLDIASTGDTRRKPLNMQACLKKT
jgi:Ser/Thr protein kinase RdoA (MazF antagonist)